MIQSPIKTNSQVQNFSPKKKKNQFNTDGKNPFLSKKNKYTAYTARQPVLHKTLTTAKSRIMHTHTYTHTPHTNSHKPHQTESKNPKVQKRRKTGTLDQFHSTSWYNKERGREEGREGEHVRGREETMAEPREAPSTSWSSPSGHKNAGVTRFVMEVLAPSSGRSREKERGEGGRGGGKPSKRVGSSGWRVSTDRIKGVRPTVLWKELYGAEHHPDMQKRAIISVLHFSTNRCRCIGYVIVGVCGCCV